MNEYLQVGFLTAILIIAVAAMRYIMGDDDE